jgi:hypothetical protein
MEVFLQFDDRMEVTLNDTVGWHIPRRGDTLEYEPSPGETTVRYEIVDVVNCVDYRFILSKIRIVLQRAP